MGEQGVVLEDGVDRAPVGGNALDVLAANQILMDAYGDTLPSPVCDHFELVEVVKALAPFFARPLRGLLSGVRKDVAASKGPGTPTAG